MLCNESQCTSTIVLNSQIDIDLHNRARSIHNIILHIINLYILCVKIPSALPTRACMIHTIQIFLNLHNSQFSWSS